MLFGFKWEVSNIGKRAEERKGVWSLGRGKKSWRKNGEGWIVLVLKNLAMAIWGGRKVGV